MLLNLIEAVGLKPSGSVVLYLFEDFALLVGSELPVAVHARDVEQKRPGDDEEGAEDELDDAPGGIAVGPAAAEGVRVQEQTRHP